MRLLVGQAVAAGAAGLAEAAEEPLLCDVARLVDGPLRLLVLLAILLDLPREVLFLALFALVVVITEHHIEVRGPHGRRVEPLLVGVGELVVEDGDGVVDAASLEGVASSALVVDEVVIDKVDGHTERALQRDSVVRDLRDGVRLASSS